MDMREDMRNRDMRYMGDGRNPYGRRGGYARNARGGRGRGRRMAMMDYAGYPDMRGMDGHYGHGGQSMGGQTYYPIEAMGRFNGYWGMPEQDYARRDMGYRNYDMRGRDYGYDDYGDYGETLSEQELEHWCKKLMQKIEEKYKPFFTKENIVQRAKQRGYQMKEFGENELYTATLMQYTDLCKELKPFVGENLDAYIGAGYAFLVDDDAGVKGKKKLTRYFDEIVEGEED